MRHAPAGGRLYYFTEIEGPVGRLLLAGDREFLRAIRFGEGRSAGPEPGWRRDHEPFRKVIGELQAYFAGELTKFSVAVDPAGTPFQKRVWADLVRIPYGTSISDGELARRVGNPAAARAVGLANGANPVPIVIPCHRVIGSNGRLTGYGGGLSRKELLLALERRQLTLL